MLSSSGTSGCVVDDEGSAGSMRKPLPTGYFAKVQISASQRQQYCDLVQRRVSALLAQDNDDDCTGAQQESNWKVLRRIESVNVYQRRLRGRMKRIAAAYEELPEAAVAVERGNPSMKVHGTARGVIEDMIFGISATTQAEMLTGMTFVAPVHDAALLSVVDQSTEAEPLRSAEVIWVLTKLPIMHPRDFCYLKATGTGIDADGRFYGYLVLHSVDMPECPPFDYRQTKTLRAKVYFSFLFRESTPGFVTVSGRGVFDLDGGELIQRVLPHVTSAMIHGLLRGGRCSEAKKLTLLALRNGTERRPAPALTKKSVCSMCIRRNQRMIPGARLRSCDGCGVFVCTSCRIKGKRIFFGTKRPSRTAVCCVTCAHQSTEITGVRLGVPEFLVEAEYFGKSRSRSCYSPSRVSVALLSPASRSSDSSGIVARGTDAGAFNSTTSHLSDHTAPASSVAKTNSTLGDSGTSFDETVSLPSHGNLRVKNGEHCDEDGAALSVDKDAEIGDEPKETVQSDKVRVEPWSNLHQVITFSDFGTPLKQRPNSLLEWMQELQTSADEAYSTAKANEELMKKSMR